AGADAAGRCRRPEPCCGLLPVLVEAELVVRAMERVAEIRLRRRSARRPVPGQPILTVRRSIRERERRASGHRSLAPAGGPRDAAGTRVARQAAAARGVLAGARSVAAVDGAEVAVLGTRCSARLEPAGRRAAVATHCVAVVALLAGVDHAVAAGGTAAVAGHRSAWETTEVGTRRRGRLDVA